MPKDNIRQGTERYKITHFKHIHINEKPPTDKIAFISRWQYF
jgi:hypothetical protein